MTGTGDDFPLLLGPEELAGRPGEVVLADVRWYLDGRSGRAAFEAGHLPGAVFLDLDADLAAAGDPKAGRHPLPSPEAFATSLGRAGIPEGRAVVAYDDSGGGTASRLVWMLRAIGQPAGLLDGGLAGFEGPLETGPGTPRPAVERVAVGWPAEALAAPDELGTGVLLDARAPERYRGDLEPVDPRAGHIPGAVNLPWTTLLDERGRFLAPGELRRRFADKGAASGPVIVSCGSGVTACALALAHEVAGLGAVRLFVASFSGWSSDRARDVVVGG